MLAQLPLDPRHEEIDDSLLPLSGDGDAARHIPPLREAVAATAGTGVLGDEHRMAAHRSLLAIIRRVRRCEARADEVLAVAADCIDAFFVDIFPISSREVEATAELRLRKPSKSRIIAINQISTHVGS